MDAIGVVMILRHFIAYEFIIINRPINNPASKIPQASQMLRRLDEQNPLKIVQLSCQFNHF